MEEFQAILDMIDALGVKSFLAPFIGFFLVLWLAKMTVFKGSGAWAKALWETWLSEHRRRIEVEVKLEKSLAHLVDEFEQIPKLLMSTREYYDARIDKIEDTIIRLDETCRNILFFAKKRRADWIREGDKEIE